MGLPAVLLVWSPLPNQSGPQGSRSQSGLEGGKRPTYRARMIEGGWERLSTRGLNAALRSGTSVCRSPLFLRAQPRPQSPLRESGLCREVGAPEGVFCEFLQLPSLAPGHRPEEATGVKSTGSR